MHNNTCLGKCTEKKVSSLGNTIEVDTLTTVDLREIVRIGKIVFDNIKGWLFKKQFDNLPFWRLAKIVFQLIKQNKKEEKVTLVQMKKLNMKAFCSMF